MLDSHLSQHPTDRLIRELIQTERRALSHEIDAIVDRIATAPFDPDPAVVVSTKHRGLVYQGRVLGSRESSLTYHLVKRVVVDRQWAFGTTAEEYVDDLRSAVQTSDAQVAVYFRRGGHMAAVVAPCQVDWTRLGPKADPWILVVFSADRGTILSGYQVESERPPNIPEDALWLK